MKRFNIVCKTVFYTAIASIFAMDVQIAFADQLEEVIVTARKNEESLQEVPVAVTSLSGETMERFAMDTIQDMGDRVPGLMIYAGGSGQGGGIFLRGIGSQPSAGAFEPSAAINLDGEVISTARIVVNSFFDLESFEVLKGPQPLYFGKGATAGVLSLRSRNPGDEFEASVMAGWEFEEKAYSVEGVISGPLSDTVGARLAVRNKKSDEFMKNIAPGVAHEYRNEESTDMRLTLDWDASEDLYLNWKINYHKFKNDGQSNFIRSICVNGCDGATGPGNEPRLGLNDHGEVSIYDSGPAAVGGTDKYLADGVPFTDNDTWNTRLLAEWDIRDDLRLVSTSSWLDLEDVNLENYADVASAAGTSGSLNTFKVLTQEIRFEGTHDRFNYMLGGFYEDHEQVFGAEQYVGLAYLFPADTPGYEGSTFDVQKIHATNSKTWSYFGSIEFDFTDQLSLSLGARYTDIKRDGTITILYANQGLNALLAGGMGVTTGPGDGFDDATGLPAFLVPGGSDVVGGLNEPWQSGQINYKDTATTPEVVLTYKLADSSMIYAAYKEAFKPGGIDNGNGAFSPDLPIGKAAGWPVGGGTVFDSEEVKGFEVGYKGELLGRTLRLNTVFYNYKYSEFQVQTFRGLSFDTENAGKVLSQGIDTDVLWSTPIEGLTLSAALLWDNSEYQKYTNSLTGVVLDNRRLAQSPEWAGNLGFEYTRPMTDGINFDITYNWRYSDKYYADSIGVDVVTENTYIQDSYSTHDLAISLLSADDTWSVILAGRNITDEYWVSFGGFRVQTGSVPFGDKDLNVRENPGRTIALSFKYNFH
jgi:iron complex outermembrane receptor protein